MQTFVEKGNLSIQALSFYLFLGPQKLRRQNMATDTTAFLLWFASHQTLSLPRAAMCKVATWGSRGRLRSLPRAQASGAQPHEHRAYELPERGGVHGLQFLLLAVQQVVAVQGGTRQTHSFSCLVVVQQPLYLTHRQRGGNNGRMS